MPDVRRNPITGHWVIVAENRDRRPREIEIQQVAQDRFECPFCEGHEYNTPGETLARRAPRSKPDGPGWRVRIVPNLYPAFDAADGLHEVIIESERHLTSVTQLDDSQFAEVLDVYRERLAMLRQEGAFRDVSLFKNSGILGGATLSHVHSQLIAMNGPNDMLATRAANFQAYYQQNGVCPACQMVSGDAEGDRLIVDQSEHFAAVCPYASRLAYEVWILPRQHAPNFDNIAPETLPEFAGLFRRVLIKLERTIGLPAYNYNIHTVGFDTSAADHYHWQVEILPRTTTLAGFELGTDCYINTVSPERAAQILRMA